VKPKKVVIHIPPLSHFSLSAMHEVVGKGVLPNSFPKQFSFILKTAHETI
jgi:hypothetical protein